MRILDSLSFFQENTKESFSLHEGTALTLGNFDGCHVGHQKLIGLTKQLAAKNSLKSGAISFSPRPEVFFKQSSVSDNLFNERQKIQAFRESGIDTLLLQEFNEALSLLDYKIFYDVFLCRYLHYKIVVMGYDFRFGHKRMGSFHWVKQRALAQGKEAYVVSPITCESHDVSSSFIRGILKEKGDVELAQKMLGRPYLLEGLSIKGDGIARQLGFPTINLFCEHQLIPYEGIYAGYVYLDKDRYPSVTSVNQGTYRAVFCISRLKELKIEAHLLEGHWPMEPSLYGLKCGFYLAYRIRSILAFQNEEELKKEMSEDVKKARNILI